MSKSRQLGIRLKPPALILIYPSDDKMRRRIMPIRHFRKTSNVTFVAAEMRARHEVQLTEVPTAAIEKMLRLLQEHLKGVPLEEALARVEKQSEKTTENDDEDDDKIETTWYRDDDDIDDDFWLRHVPNTEIVVKLDDIAESGTGSSIKYVTQIRPERKPYLTIFRQFPLLLGATKVPVRKSSGKAPSPGEFA